MRSGITEAQIAAMLGRMIASPGVTHTWITPSVPRAKWIMSRVREVAKALGLPVVSNSFDAAIRFSNSSSVEFKSADVIDAARGGSRYGGTQ